MQKGDFIQTQGQVPWVERDAARKGVFHLFNLKALKTREFWGLRVSYRLIIALLLSTQTISAVIPGSTGTGTV